MMGSQCVWALGECSPRPHPHTYPIINKYTEQVKKAMYGFIMEPGYRSKTHYYAEKQGFGYRWLSKYFTHTHHSVALPRSPPG